MQATSSQILTEISRDRVAEGWITSSGKSTIGACEGDTHTPDSIIGGISVAQVFLIYNKIIIPLLCLALESRLYIIMGCLTSITIVTAVPEK